MVKIPVKNARRPAAWLRRAPVWTVAAVGAAVLATGGVALASATPSSSGQIRASGDVVSVTAQHLDPQPNFTKRN